LLFGSVSALLGQSFSEIAKLWETEGGDHKVNWHLTNLFFIRSRKFLFRRIITLKYPTLLEQYHITIMLSCKINCVNASLVVGAHYFECSLKTGEVPKDCLGTTEIKLPMCSLKSFHLQPKSIFWGSNTG